MTKREYKYHQHNDMVRLRPDSKFRGLLWHIKYGKEHVIQDLGNLKLVASI